MATRFLPTCLLLGIIVFSSGCSRGLLYTAVTEPLVTNMRNTPRGDTGKAFDGAKVISVPTTILAAGWDDQAIGSAAKSAGLSTVYYADLETFSVLLGLWQESKVNIYGK